MLIIQSINLVYAEELKDITEDVEIRYKWYQEVIEGDYYPLRTNQEGYLIDINKIKYVTRSGWDQTNCNLSDDYYLKEYEIKRGYKTVDKIRYVKLENFTFNNNIKIYNDNQLLTPDLSINENLVLINLKNDYLVDNLTFYIINDEEFKISLYQIRSLEDAVLSKNIKDEELLIADETWITSTTKFRNYYTNEELKETSLTKKFQEYNICSIKEKYVYKYKIKKEYYDNNYYLNVDGYIKDVNDYKIFYKDIPITNTIEIIKEIPKEKIVNQSKIEYIYIPNENNIQKNDSSKEPECIPKIKTEIIEKEIFKIPKKIYIVIFLLILISLYLLIKKNKKHVE